MNIIVGFMNGRWVKDKEHVSENQAFKIANRLSDETGHKHIVMDEKVYKALYE